MRLDKLTIGSDKPPINGTDNHRFKNLKNVTIDFDETEWITVVVGWNGTGKSNVLEALATIFRNLIGKPTRKGKHTPPEAPPFSYVLHYNCHGKFVIIDADPDRDTYYKIRYAELNELTSSQAEKQELPLQNIGESPRYKDITSAAFAKRRDEFLPNYVFGYYSGHSTRMNDVFAPYLEKYDDNLRNGVDPGLRKMFYAKPDHSHFALLAFVLNNEKFVQEFLENKFGMDTEVGIESILFVLNEPPWKSKSSDGDPRFWMARGVVKDFLSRLYEVALAPIRINRRTQTSLWNSTTLEYLYLFVKDLDALRKLVGKKSPREFFKELESTYVSELINKVRIRLKLKNNDGTVVFHELSEGEQQLLAVLGLLNFTAEEDSLFLLDEPDTHLNPQWSVDYFRYLKMFVNSGKADGASSHIVLNTHNPLAVAELSRGQLQILYRDPEYLTITSHMPEHDPRGMGYSGVVTSDMFGLASELDKRTQRRLEVYRTLASINDRNPMQERRYKIISRWLDADRFNLMQRDDDYQRYLILRRKALENAAKTDDYQDLIKFALNLNAEERGKIAKQAIDDLLAGEC